VGEERKNVQGPNAELGTETHCIDIDSYVTVVMNPKLKNPCLCMICAAELQMLRSIYAGTRKFIHCEPLYIILPKDLDRKTFAF
jgi:hypothetical protein